MLDHTQADALPAWQWLPSDGDADSLAPISAWCASTPHVMRPMQIDVAAATWPGVPAQVDAVFCANLLLVLARRAGAP